MKEKIKFTFALFTLAFALAFFTPFMSATSGCCQVTSGGAWCQEVSDIASECNPSYSSAPTSCDSFSPCSLGTCIDPSSGVCSPNVPQALCEQTPSATWDPQEIDQIPFCRPGCCFAEDGTSSYLTQVACNQLASDTGIEVQFNPNIDHISCQLLSYSQEDGACVTGEFDTECSMTKRESCDSAGGTFHPGLLCTAPSLGTNCAPTDNRIEKDRKVYFQDSCGNFANVYDSTKFTSGSNYDADYWEAIVDPVDSCVVNGGTELPPGEVDSSCGNCEYYEGSVARKSGGQLVCGSIACVYDTDNDGQMEEYRHGESWCAVPDWMNGVDIPREWPNRQVTQSNYNDGELYPIQVDGLTSEILSYARQELETNDVYSLPGSEYYSLTCEEGEVVQTSCAPMRNEVCKEFKIEEDFSQARCTQNLWHACPEIGTKEQCESAFGSDTLGGSAVIDCQWIGGDGLGEYGWGYKWDHTLTYDENFEEELEKRSEEQGVCVPLFAPGLTFWDGDQSAGDACDLAYDEAYTFYEFPVTKSREKFKDASVKEAANRCLENCYAIPGYGEDLGAEAIQNFWGGAALPDSPGNFHLSERKGQYCAKPGNPEKKKLGKVGSNDLKCLDGEEERRALPPFYTNTQWLNFITKRASAVGDCGFKEHAFSSMTNYVGDPESETITAMFEIVNQKGEPKRNFSEDIIYNAQEGYLEGVYRDE